MYEDRLPLTEFQVIDLNQTARVDIQVQRRKARLKGGVEPTADNAWVYRTQDSDGSVLDNFLGPILTVRSRHPAQINWINTLGPAMGMTDVQEPPPIVMPDPSMDMMPQPPRGIVTHLHGARVHESSDGWPLEPAGFVANDCGFPSVRRYRYENNQRATLLWYHDHSMDNTAPHVHAGLAGLYFIRDDSDRELAEQLHDRAGNTEIPLVIQDRVVRDNFQGVDYKAGLVDRPEFLGDTIFVNGRPSPFFDAERRVYRLRVLNGSNARSYALALLNPDDWTWHTGRLRLIGTDGGLMARSEHLADNGYLVIAPGERRDVLLDLTGLPGTTRLRLMNLALAGRVRGDTPEPIYTYGLPRFAGDVAHSVLTEAQRTASILNGAGIESLAGLLELRLAAAPDVPSRSHLVRHVNDILDDHASGDGFSWNRRHHQLEPTWSIRANRLVLLLNNTAGKAGWSDVQMLEMTDDSSGDQWPLAFGIDLAGSQPADDDQPLNYRSYRIARRSFFTEPRQTHPGQCYPDLGDATVHPEAGSYERWYVANVGTEDSDKQVDRGNPDMHPFHIHLVNFVVARRWIKNAEGRFVRSPRSLLDGIARHDTVRVTSDELLELIVHFPQGYDRERFVYHCHLVEHEDMGMMLHYQLR